MSTQPDSQHQGDSTNNGMARLDTFSSIYGPRLGLIALIIAIVSLVATYDKILGFVVLLILIILLVVYSYAPHIRRHIRLWSFHYLRISTVALMGAALVGVLALRFLFNLVVGHTLEIDEILFNVLYLNILVALLFLLFLSGRVQVLDPAELLIRLQGSDALYLWSAAAGELSFIPDPPTMVIHGLRTTDVRSVSNEEFQTYRQGTPLTSVRDATIIKIASEHWLVMGNVCRRIPDGATLGFALAVGASGPVDADHLGQLKRGPDLPSVAGFR